MILVLIRGPDPGIRVIEKHDLPHKRVLHLERKGNMLELNTFFEIVCFLDVAELVFKSSWKVVSLGDVLVIGAMQDIFRIHKIVGKSCSKQEGTLMWVDLWAVQVLIKIRDGKL